MPFTAYSVKLTSPQKNFRGTRRHGFCRAGAKDFQRGFAVVRNYLNRAKNHNASAAIPIFGSHAAVSGSTISFVASEAAKLEST